MQLYFTDGSALHAPASVEGVAEAQELVDAAADRWTAELMADNR